MTLFFSLYPKSVLLCSMSFFSIKFTAYSPLGYIVLSPPPKKKILLVKKINFKLYLSSPSTHSYWRVVLFLLIIFPFVFVPSQANPRQVKTITPKRYSGRTSKRDTMKPGREEMGHTRSRVRPLESATTGSGTFETYKDHPGPMNSPSCHPQNRYSVLNLRQHYMITCNKHVTGVHTYSTTNLLYLLPLQSCIHHWTLTFHSICSYRVFPSLGLQLFSFSLFHSSSILFLSMDIKLIHQGSCSSTLPVSPRHHLTSVIRSPSPSTP